MEAIDPGYGGSIQQPGYCTHNRMCVHPKFLHSNATSHKWPFGELLDNAVDAIKTGGATTILVDKVIDKRNGSPALLIQDDGGGMDPDSFRRCMCFGFSEKQSGSFIGEYGNGFKTSTMRLGADAIVFTRCTKSRLPTQQSIGLLSYTFLLETGQTDVVIPMVDYECNLIKGKTQRLEPHGSEKFSSNLTTLLKWSPFATEEELMQNFCDIGPHGTKIIVFNLWFNDDGNLELDFDTNPHDIMISGAPNPEEIRNLEKRANENYLANRLRYSLRLPHDTRIKLRGQEVKQHHIVNDLKCIECIAYNPQIHGKNEVVTTTIGFLKGAPIIRVHGFHIYHKNRLILPFHSVLSSASSKGKGVCGVLEVDFIEPTHDKQDFKKSQQFQRLMTRLKDMTNEYWNIHSEKIGFAKRVRATPTPLSPLVMLPIANGPAEPSERIAPALAHAIMTQPSRSNSNYVSAVPIAFAAPPGFHSAPFRKEEAVAPVAPMGYSASSSTNMMQTMQVINQTKAPSMVPGTNLVETRKRRTDDTIMKAVASKRTAVESLAGSSSSATDQVSKSMGEAELKEYSLLMVENKNLREECAEFEMTEKQLRLKEQNLRLEIEKARKLYQSLLSEHVSKYIPLQQRLPRIEEAVMLSTDSRCRH